MDLKRSAKKFGADFWKYTKKVFSYLDSHTWLLSIVIGVLLNFIIECLHRHSFWQGILHTVTSPLPFLFNSLVISTVMAICSLFKR